MSPGREGRETWPGPKEGCVWSVGFREDPTQLALLALGGLGSALSLVPRRSEPPPSQAELLPTVF